MSDKLNYSFKWHGIGCLKVLSIVLLTTTGSMAQVMTPISQPEPPAVTGYLEILGNSGLYTINYDVTYSNGYGFRIGMMPFPFAGTHAFDNDLTVDNILFLVMPHRLFGTGTNRLEVGAGGLLGTVNQDWDFIKPPGLTVTFGYRRQPTFDSSKFLFRIGLTPILAENKIYLRAGISIGLLINKDDGY